jgi:putative DNA methylase
MRHLTGGHIAPVDLAQAAIGPGMGVFSRYSKVLEPNGEAMTVRRALELINSALEEYFNELEGVFDKDTQFCTAWFAEHRFLEGKYGQALVLSQAKSVGIDALARDGVLTAKGGEVQLLPLVHYIDHLASYDPGADKRLSAWEACHYLAAALRSGGESAAARLARRLGGIADDARDLAYRLYSICERKKWQEEARAYNELVASWPEIQKLAVQLAGERQGTLGTSGSSN